MRLEFPDRNQCWRSSLIFSPGSVRSAGSESRLCASLRPLRGAHRTRGLDSLPSPLLCCFQLGKNEKKNGTQLASVGECHDNAAGSFLGTEQSAIMSLKQGIAAPSDDQQIMWERVAIHGIAYREQVFIETDIHDVIAAGATESNQYLLEPRLGIAQDRAIRKRRNRGLEIVGVKQHLALLDNLGMQLGPEPAS